MSFQELGLMAQAERDRMGFVPQATNARAAHLAMQLRPLDRIRPVLERRYLVKGWIDKGACSTVYAESNVGKSFMALDMALHVAAGADWHGARVHEPAPVIYIAAEGGRGLHNRIEAMRREMPDLMRAAASNFTLLADGLNLCTANDAQHLAEALGNAGIRPGLIIIDTLARVMGEGDENTAKDMGLLIRSVDHLREATGAHVMVIHHSGKDTTKGARGSGSLRGAVDTEIELTRDGDLITATMRKQRDMACDGAFGFRLKGVFIGHDEDGDAVTSAVVEECGVPAKKGNAPKLTGTDKIGLNALDDALTDHGQPMQDARFPKGQRCVSLDHWRAQCDRQSLTTGEGESSRRSAFHKVKTRLQDKDMIRVLDGFVWRVTTVPAKDRSQAAGNAETGFGNAGNAAPFPRENTPKTPETPAIADDGADRSHRSQPFPGNAGNAGHATVPSVPPVYRTGERGNAVPTVKARAHWTPDPDALDPEMWR